MLLLPWLALIAAFIGGISFAGMIAAWNRKLRRSHRFSIFPKQPFSLWSLILFLFFPPVSKLYVPGHLVPESNRPTGGCSGV